MRTIQKSFGLGLACLCGCGVFSEIAWAASPSWKLTSTAPRSFQLTDQPLTLVTTASGFTLSVSSASAPPPTANVSGYASIFGENTNDTGGVAIRGIAYRGAGVGLWGEAAQGTTNGIGVYGYNNNTNGIAIKGQSNSGSGIYGSSLSPAPPTANVAGYASIFGENMNAKGGVAIRGIAYRGAGVGLWGEAAQGTINGIGVYGYNNNTDGVAVKGQSNSGVGLYGSSLSAPPPTANIPGYAAIFGENKNANGGVAIRGIAYQGAGIGVWGEAAQGTTNSIGVYGYNNNSSGAAVKGVAGFGIGVHGVSGTSGYAGYFQGRVAIKGNLELTGGQIVSPSDRRLKHEIRTYSEGLSVISQIKPVTYRYNGLGGVDETVSGAPIVGIIAQDLKEVAPYMVQIRKAKLHPEDEKETELLSVNDKAFTYMLINAVKELAQQNREMKKLLCADHPEAALCQTEPLK